MRTMPGHVGDLGVGEAAEVAEENDPGAIGALALELVEGALEIEEILRRRLKGNLRFLELYPQEVSAALGAGLAPGVLDHDVAHRPAGGEEEVPAALEAAGLAADHPPRIDACHL
jgi:hypothetical protein